MALDADDEAARPRAYLLSEPDPYPNPKRTWATNPNPSPSEPNPNPAHPTYQVAWLRVPAAQAAGRKGKGQAEGESLLAYKIELHWPLDERW